MKKMLSKDLITKSRGGEYLNVISPGDLFISFHDANENCVAVYLEKKDLNNSTLESLYKELIPFFDLLSSKVKIIGEFSSVKIAELFFISKNILFLKKIEKIGKTEVMFLPLMNKVRVTKLSISSDSNILANKEPLNLQRKIKIMIVDDSKSMRKILFHIFASDPLFEVCAMAEKPSEVEGLILKDRPDVITLDIHMPEMDGVSLLKIISPKYKIPTIIISSLSLSEGPLVMDALENGAIDYIQKPQMEDIEKVKPLMFEKIRMAASSNISKTIKNANHKILKTNHLSDLSSLVVLGASTGGVDAIKEILIRLPDEIPAILIVQHIPAIFSSAFAKRMNELTNFEVKEAVCGDEVRANRVLIAPGGKQMKLVYKNGMATVDINDDEPVNRFKPSIDYLFFSVAKNIYTNTVAVVLTGMGKDGAKGMLELKKCNAHTIAQDELSSVVFGMPREAIAIGAAQHIETLSGIAEKITLLSNIKK